MKFIDKTALKVKAGDGGNGHISFRREAFVPRGGPDGGDGGKGGDVFIQGDPGNNTLLHLRLNNKIQAENGENGKRKNQTGKGGLDTFIKVPLGTMVFNDGKLIMDITTQEPVLLAKGGFGGKGNSKFKSSVNKAPRIANKGDKGESLNLSLVLKVLADVGFVGKPSAGKSTLLSKISNAVPKIADYDFTTLTPQLGLVQINDRSFVAADLPGLIEFASQGKGLGHEFLKHIERCKVIAHIIDFGSANKNPIEDFEIINKELETYKEGLSKRTQVIIANKSDLEVFEDHYKKFTKKFPKLEVISISALQEKNIKAVKNSLLKALDKAEAITFEVDFDETTIELKPQIVIDKIGLDYYEVSGEQVEGIYNKIPLNTNENIMRFNSKLESIGLWDKLREQGIKEGNTVRIFGYEFIWGEEQW